MGNSSFESQVGLFDEESKLSFYVESNGSQQSSPQSAKLVLEGYGKSPTFGNRRAPSQKVVKGDLLGKSLAAGHPSSKITDGSQRESVPKSNISQQISAQSAKLFFEGFGESPTFGKRICPSQDVVKENNKRDLHGKSLIADQPSFEKTGHSQKESVPRSNGSQQSSAQSAKLILEGYGKSPPTFEKRICPTQGIVKENSERDIHGKSLVVGQPSSNISQQISAQSAKLFFEGFGESPTFGKRICPSQDVVKENNKRDLHGKSLIADQPSFEKTGHSQKESVPRSNGSQQSSAQSAKLILEGYGKSPPTFEKRICPTQGIVKENSERDIHGKSLVVGQPSSEITGNSQKESVRRSSQDMDVPDFDSKDKMYWFTEHKRQRALCKRLKKQLECKDLRIKLISQQIKVLSDLLNN